MPPKRAPPTNRRLRNKTIDPSWKRSKARRKAAEARLQLLRLSGGSVPKARRPFAIFCADKKDVLKGDPNSYFWRASVLWRGLSYAERNSYAAKAKEELALKVSAERREGLRNARRKNGRGRGRTNKTHRDKDVRDKDVVGQAAAAGAGEGAEDVAGQAAAAGEGEEAAGAGANGMAETAYAETAGIFPKQVVQEDVAMTLGNWQWKTRAANLLGHGSYGAVFLATNVETGQRGAAKVYAVAGDAERELKILRLLPACSEFPNVIACAIGPGVNALVLQICANDLRRVMRNGECTHDVLFAVFQQIRGALIKLHQIGLIHNDVKPGNILWTQLGAQAVLADFSLTEKNGALVHAKFQATMNYRPPELLRSSGQKPCCVATDVWSFGCTIWEAAATANFGQARRAEPLFPGTTEEQILDQTRELETDNPRMRVRVQAAGIYRVVVLRCCRHQPQMR